MRGCECSPNCITSPSTRPISQSSRSISCLSRTSRTRSISASDDLERYGNDRQDERDQDDNRHDGIADPPVAMLAEVYRIIHQEQERDNCEWKSRCSKRHRDHRHFDWIDAKYQRNRSEQNYDSVGQAKSGVFGWGYILTPIPAEALCEEVGNGERDLESRTEARQQHGYGEKIEAPLGKGRRHE